MPRSRRLICTLMLTALAATAHADEASVRKGMDGFIGSPAVESLTKTPYGGLWEVVLKSGEIVYTDDQVSFIIDGSVIDAKSRRNMTQMRQNQLSTIDFNTLPLDQAVKVVRGNGTRTIATFEDPNCGYCKKLVRELQGIKDATIYTFLYPILSPDSADKSKNIWCAKDRSKAWTDWMIDGKTPPSAACDTGAIDKNLALGRKLRIQGTPTLFLTDGSRIGGYVPVADLDKTLAQLKK
ncbi:MAG: DsbC family protein [Zoogloeaceae bacterium]|nr:DsbC family protein [Zoogloeaceae bacterium]